MIRESAPNQSCQRGEIIAAYLDGELDGAADALFEQHLKECARCAAQLARQRRLLSALNTALTEARRTEVVLPGDFARLVAARASADLRGVRRGPERRRALALCLLLAVVALASLGLTAFGATLSPLATVARETLCVLEFIGHVLVETGAGAAVILRAASGPLVGAPSLFKALVWTLFAGAGVLLPRLINRYHRLRTFPE